MRGGDKLSLEKIQALLEATIEVRFMGHSRSSHLRVFRNPARSTELPAHDRARVIATRLERLRLRDGVRCSVAEVRWQVPTFRASVRKPVMMLAREGLQIACRQ